MDHGYGFGVTNADFFLLKIDLIEMYKNILNIGSVANYKMSYITKLLLLWFTTKADWNGHKYFNEANILYKASSLKSHSLLLIIFLLKITWFIMLYFNLIISIGICYRSI